MRSTRQIHVHPSGATIYPPVRKTTSTKILSSNWFKILLVVGGLLMITASIVIPILLIKRSKDKPTSSSVIRVTSTKTNYISTAGSSNSTSTTTRRTSLISSRTSTRFIPTRTTLRRTSTKSTINSSSVEATSSTTLSTVTTSILRTAVTSDLPISDTSMMMVDATEEFFTDGVDSNFTLVESTIETIRSTTTTMIPLNLLINPGAEEGSTVGWNQIASSPVIVDSDGKFNSGYYPHSGSYCFAGGYGSSSASSGLVQNVNLLGGVQGLTESQLNSRMFQAELQFYYQTWDSLFMRHDQVEVSLRFRSSTSAIIQTVTTGELACKTSNPGWCTYNRIFPLPRNTRSIDYTMSFIRKDVVGTNIDSYIDDNSLKIR